jgi:diphosphomevalonate decarboxylase
MAHPFKISYSSGDSSGKVTWQCPSNIALVKYWGKRGHQLPSNPSLSFSLTQCYTKTTIGFEIVDAFTSPVIGFSFNGNPNQKFQQRINDYVQNLTIDIPVIEHMRLNIHTENTFPHSAGIASSASAFGSIALCLCSIEKMVLGEITGEMDFLRKASYLARLGSGSACRSIYPGYVVWGESAYYKDFTNLYATALPFEIHADFRKMSDTLLVVSSQEKKLSSSAGHDLMKEHPFAAGRYDQAQKNLEDMIIALRTGDADLFIKVTETEALSLHALIMSSDTGELLIKSNTLDLIEKITGFRKAQKIPVCFTLDAGPNIHLLYPEKYKDKVHPFVESELRPLCENQNIIYDTMGKGPEEIANKE